MNINIVKNIKENPKLRESFLSLAIETFDLSFQEWYQKGYWTDSYIPYSIVDQGMVVANASVNIIDTLWDNQPKRYIQIGTVMTQTTYRGKGLSRHIIEEILNDWQTNCDAIYLYTNDTVLDFYPKFGFVKEVEHQFTLSIIPKAGILKKLDMSNANDLALLKQYYEKSNPYSALPMLNNYGLLMFYCASFLKDCVYYCEELDAVVIATSEDNTLTCFAIYCEKQTLLLDILATVANPQINTVTLGFTPKDLTNCIVKPITGEEDTLFVYKNKENIFAKNKVMFPSLSHA